MKSIGQVRKKCEEEARLLKNNKKSWPSILCIRKACTMIAMLIKIKMGYTSKTLNILSTK